MRGVVSANPPAVLFLGTEKYPKEGDFENFLTQHGGSSNAVSTGATGCKQAAISLVGDAYTPAKRLSRRKGCMRTLLRIFPLYVRVV